MSDDVIKRSDAIRATWQEPTYIDPLNVLTEVRDRIEAIPSADRPQGEWICEMTKSQDQARDRWVIERVVLYCSECKREAVKMTKFCPNCGCRMEGADDE